MNWNIKTINGLAFICPINLNKHILEIQIKITIRWHADFISFNLFRIYICVCVCLFVFVRRVPVLMNQQKQRSNWHRSPKKKQHIHPVPNGMSHLLKPWKCFCFSILSHDRLLSIFESISLINRYNDHYI